MTAAPPLGPVRAKALDAGCSPEGAEAKLAEPNVVRRLFSVPTPGGREARSRRAHAVRATTISAKRTTKRELFVLRLLNEREEEDPDRPRTRGECAEGVRPCPYVACRHHLYLDANESTGAVKVNFPHMEPDEIPITCSLDAAEAGGMQLEVIGSVMNMTRERIRQVEIAALAKLKLGGRMRDWEGHEAAVRS